MNLPGLLIEYLINGAIALIWLSQISIFSTLTAVSATGMEIVLIPIAYVIGMFIDYIAWFLTRPVKGFIRSKVRDELAHELSFASDDYKDRWTDKLKIETDYANLSKQLESKSSRDRIARGTIINLILINVFFWSSIHVYGLVLIFLAFCMWWKFEKQNYSYEVRAAHLLRTKN